jgi:histidinol-phosphate aminotransferase
LRGGGPACYHARAMTTTDAPSQAEIAVSENILRLKPYVPGKPIEEVQREYGLTDIVKLASNENPLGPSARAVAAMREAAAHVALYPDASCYRLTQALAVHWRVAPENLILGNGSDEIIQFIGMAFLEPGDEVLTATPSFVRYEAAATLNNASLIEVPLRDFRFDLPAMAERLSPRTRVVFIANPNNPTGTIVMRTELERFLDRVPARALVVMDEAYFEYADAPEYPDGWEYVRQGRNVVVLRTFSKIYGLAGLRVGYGMARPELIRYLHQVREPFNVNSLAQAAAIASLEDPEQVERSRQVNREGKAALTTAFDAMGLPHVPTEANFVLVDVKRNCREVFEGLLRRGVIVRTGDIFALPTHLRVTIGTAEQNERLLQALRGVLGA